MKLLLDVSTEKLAGLQDAHPQYVAGQLLTPASSFLLADGVPWAMDNGCFGTFERAKWERLLTVNQDRRDRCLWVTAPDVVGSARRTLEVFEHWGNWLIDKGWPVALVAQDGIEDLPISWDHIDAIFIGGTDRFKDSDNAKQVAKAARLLGKQVHVGRVNAGRIANWRGHADTGDGSGYSRFTNEMFSRLVNADERREATRPLFENTQLSSSAVPRTR